MPRSSATPCNKPGCGALTYTRFCSEHKQVEHRRSSNARGYDSAWRRLSNRYREANPLCEPCKAKGEFVPVALVDHVIPVHVAPERVHDMDNLQGMCRPCHAEKTAADDLTYGSATTRRFAGLRG